MCIDSREQLQIDKAELLIRQEPTAKTNCRTKSILNLYSLCPLLFDVSYRKIELFAG